MIGGRLRGGIVAMAGLLSGCEQGTLPGQMPDAPGAQITISAGTSEWGGSRTQVFATDLSVTTRWEGVGRGETVSEATLAPGTHARALAYLAREGPLAQARQGPDVQACPGDETFIAVAPPIDGFAGIGSEECFGDGPVYQALRDGLIAALRAD